MFMGFVATMAVIVTMLGFAPAATAAAPAPTQVAPVSSPSDSAAPSQTLTKRAQARCRIPYCFGALAINLRTGGSGYAYNHTSKRSALRAAKRSCARENGSGCKAVIWRRNGCAAVAWRGQNGRLVEWGARHAFTKRKAIKKARFAVRGRGTIKTWTWVCTARR
ncbi:hypothetical protein ASG90_20825 [Nocardioides sp. Soil797]|nr:hypothetical protein ASG90_20825 [Nocardioides sp. Soil797]